MLTIGEPQLNAVSTKYLPWRKFPPAIEAAYQAETGLARSRELFWRDIAALAVYLSILIADRLVMPDIFGTAVLVRLGLMTPVLLVFSAILWRNPPPAIREGLTILSVLLVAGSQAYLVLSSDSPMRAMELHAIVLLVLFIAVQRFPIEYAIAGCVGVAVIYHFALFSLTDYPTVAIVTDTLVFSGAVILSLMAPYSFERITRLNYLASLRERLLNEQLVSLSRQDPLTGLANRRALDEILGAMEIDRHGEVRLAVLMFDVDHFKAYNDSAGHQAGDVCLKRIAGVIRSELREHADMAFRFGGEEFLVLHGLDLEQAIVIGERVRRAVETAGIPHPSEPSGGPVVTISAGASATVSQDGVNAANLIAAADAALYAAKRAGRNLVHPKLGTGAQDA